MELPPIPRWNVSTAELQPKNATRPRILKRDIERVTAVNIVEFDGTFNEGIDGDFKLA